MRLIFIRHAQPDYSIDGLTEKGKKEAELLAKRTANWNVDRFYCSPLGRARDTAAPTLKVHNKEAVICDWLQEFHYRVVDPYTKVMHSLKYLEQFFASPFEMYEAMAQYLNDHNLAGVGIAVKKK